MVYFLASDSRNNTLIKTHIHVPLSQHDFSDSLNSHISNVLLYIASAKRNIINSIKYNHYI